MFDSHINFLRHNVFLLIDWLDKFLQERLDILNIDRNLFVVFRSQNSQFLYVLVHFNYLRFSWKSYRYYFLHLHLMSHHIFLHHHPLDLSYFWNDDGHYFVSCYFYSLKDSLFGTWHGDYLINFFNHMFHLRNYVLDHHWFLVNYFYCFRTFEGHYHLFFEMNHINFLNFLDDYFIPIHLF